MNMYDLVIIGGGPAGTAAAVYAARKRLKTALIVTEWGGQSNVSEDVQNWIGTIHVSGFDLAEQFKKHVLAYADDVVDVRDGETASVITRNDETFTVTTEKGSYDAKTILITTGSRRRKLDVPGAAEFEHRGITYCASCDGPLYTKKGVVVIGGGNAGFETAAQLLAYTKSVTLLNNTPEYKADPVTVQRVLSHPNMKGVANVEVLTVKGELGVTSIIYKDKETGAETELPTTGVFVEIGLLPSTEIVKEIVDLNQYNQIKIDPRTQRTSVSGIWAAGDCTDVLYHQNNIAAGDAVRALEDIYVHLRTK